MGAAYSQDLRDRVLAASDRGMKTKQIATVFSVSPAWARRIKQRRRETGEIAPRKMGGPGPRKFDRGRLAELVRAQPDATLRELRDRIGIECSESAIWTALKKMGLIFKKIQFMQQNKIDPMSQNAARTGAAPSRSVMRAG